MNPAPWPCCTRALSGHDHKLFPGIKVNLVPRLRLGRQLDGRTPKGVIHRATKGFLKIVRPFNPLIVFGAANEPKFVNDVEMGHLHSPKAFAPTSFKCFRLFLFHYRPSNDARDPTRTGNNGEYDEQMTCFHWNLLFNVLWTNNDAE